MGNNKEKGLSPQSSDQITVNDVKVVEQPYRKSLPDEITIVDSVDPDLGVVDDGITSLFSDKLVVTNIRSNVEKTTDVLTKKIAPEDIVDVREFLNKTLRKEYNIKY